MQLDSRNTQLSENVKTANFNDSGQRGFYYRAARQSVRHPVRGELKPRAYTLSGEE